MSNAKIYFLLFVFVIGFWGAMFYVVLNDPQREVRVNCSLAEISPDFTPEMKKQCRELLRHKL